MTRMLKIVAVPVLSLAVGLFAGFALGQRQGFGMSQAFLWSEIDGMLSMHVEVASSIRVGDTDRALRLLDSLIDSAVMNVHSQPLPHPVVRSMSEAKVYRRVVPPAVPYVAPVMGALANVPEPEGPPYSAPERQRSGLGRLVTRTPR